MKFGVWRIQTKLWIRKPEREKSVVYSLNTCNAKDFAAVRVRFVQERERSRLYKVLIGSWELEDSLFFSLCPKCMFMFYRGNRVQLVLVLWVLWYFWTSFTSQRKWYTVCNTVHCVTNHDLEKHQFYLLLLLWWWLWCHEVLLDRVEVYPWAKDLTLTLWDQFLSLSYYQMLSNCFLLLDLI